MVWVCSFGVPECPICKRNRLDAEAQAKAEAKAKAILDRVQRGLVAGTATLKIDRITGKPTLKGIATEGAGDDCILRAILVSGSALAKAQIAQAERIAGRPMNTN